MTGVLASSQSLVFFQKRGGMYLPSLLPFVFFFSHAVINSILRIGESFLRFFGDSFVAILTHIRMDWPIAKSFCLKTLIIKRFDLIT